MNINKSLGMRRLQAWDGTGLEDIKSIDKIEEIDWKLKALRWNKKAILYFKLNWRIQ